MARLYIPKNTTIKYWRIKIISTLENDTFSPVFKGKTLENALKAAQKYCEESNKKITYKTLSVGEVICECDYWGR